MRNQLLVVAIISVCGIVGGEDVTIDASAAGNSDAQVQHPLQSYLRSRITLDEIIWM